jgi:hypothetical protein
MLLYDKYLPPHAPHTPPTCKREAFKLNLGKKKKSNTHKALFKEPNGPSTESAAASDTTLAKHFGFWPLEVPI